jgi:hypothetical protein
MKNRQNLLPIQQNNYLSDTQSFSAATIVGLQRELGFKIPLRGVGCWVSIDPAL